jgi:hypothetical protein
MDPERTVLFLRAGIETNYGPGKVLFLRAGMETSARFLGQAGKPVGRQEESQGQGEARNSSQAEAHAATKKNFTSAMMMMF